MENQLFGGKSYYIMNHKVQRNMRQAIVENESEGQKHCWVVQLRKCDFVDVAKCGQKKCKKKK